MSLDLCSLTFKKYFYGPLPGRGEAIAPFPMDPSLTRISARASRIHADNIWLSSRLRVFDFVWFTMENELPHTYDLPINEQKRSAKSFFN